MLQNVPRRSRCATYLRSHLRAVGGCYKKSFSRHYENKYERDLKLVSRIFCDGTSVGCQDKFCEAVSVNKWKTYLCRFENGLVQTSLCAVVWFDPEFPLSY